MRKTKGTSKRRGEALIAMMAGKASSKLSTANVMQLTRGRQV